MNEPRQPPVLLWVRSDLRLADNPALTAAAMSGRPVIPVFIHDDPPDLGGASRWWLHHSLEALSRDIGALGTALVLRRGDASMVLGALVEETGADTLHFNRVPRPRETGQEEQVAGLLGSRGITVHGHDAALLFESRSVRTQAGGNFKVFTAFWKACMAMAAPSPPLPVPKVLRGWRQSVPSLDLETLGLLPAGIDWAGGLRAAWTPGERGAQERLTDFLEDGVIDSYDSDRDRPDREGTSRLGPHLAFGEISVRDVWHAVRTMCAPGNGMTRFLTELGWREFCHDLLVHHPDMAERPLRPEFKAFPWRTDHQAFRAWCKGRTGYPIVDAGMRQLWETGWMHNRVRMVTASFLVKHLLSPWQDGERWFRDTLVDADAANNAAGWQWVAGCGADAAPFFRIFNPVLQGERFDPDGAYVRRYVPELAEMPSPWIHKPWSAPPTVLAGARVQLGGTYPLPIVDHARARTLALSAFKAISRG